MSQYESQFKAFVPIFCLLPLGEFFIYTYNICYMYIKWIIIPIISLYYDQCYNCQQLSILHNTKSFVDIITTEKFDSKLGRTNKSFEFLDN